MLLAELEVRHSRPVAPTRRVALGRLWLPSDPPPGFGGILLAGIVAAFMKDLGDEEAGDLERLIDDLVAAKRIAQPRLRHRFQVDVVGLDRSHHQLVGVGESMELELDDHGSPLQQVLGATYAAGSLAAGARGSVLRLVRRATRWQGDTGERLITYLTGDEAAFKAWRHVPDESQWAREVLGLDGEALEEADIVHRFRELVRSAHPDAGGASNGAGQRISDLAEAKRILLAGR